MENGEKDIDKKDKKRCWGYGWFDALVWLLTAVAYIVIGFTVEWGWRSGWIVFFAAPVVASMRKVVIRRRAASFAFPELVVAAYLILGFFYDKWHPGWVVFLLVPAFYVICNIIQPKKSADEEKDEEK